MKKHLLLIPALLGLFIAGCSSDEVITSSTGQKESNSSNVSSETTVPPNESSTGTDTIPTSNPSSTSIISEESNSSTDTNVASSQESLSTSIVSQTSGLSVSSSVSTSGESAISSSAITSTSMASGSTSVSSSTASINAKAYLKSLISAKDHNPYSFIPSTLLSNNSENLISASQVEYDFNNSTNVSNIKYGGFGEQWHMVIENIAESENFYSVLSLGETAINSSVVLFNKYLDSNSSDEVSHSLSESGYSAKLNFDGSKLSYVIQYKTSLTIPLFGTLMPQVDMNYDVKTGEKAVRIQLTNSNCMKYSVTENHYKFALQYGIPAVSRKAYFEILKKEDSSIEGHIYEYVQYKDKDLIPSCADFYIGNEYTSVVGNKARGLVGFTGYINELYKTTEGKLLCYEVRETLTVLGVTGQYNTLWFNLNNISGITSVKAVENENFTGTYSNKNPHDIYLNGSASIFEPAYNKKLAVKTSRKYDVELRKQYFYSSSGSEIIEHETNIPMMFIQANNDKDSNFTDFPSDMSSISGITASVNLAQKYLDKVQADYSTLIDIFVTNKEKITGSAISDYIGTATVI